MQKIIYTKIVDASVVFFVGVCRNCRVLLETMESKEEPEAEREEKTEEFAGGTEVLFPMENLSLMSSHSQVEISYSYHIKNVDQHKRKMHS